MKKLLACLLLLFCAACALAEPAMRVEYYFENYCESCSPQTEFAALFKTLTGADIAGCDYVFYNTVTAEGRAALDAAAAAHGISAPALPLVIINGVVYQGDSAIQKELPFDALEWGGGSDSTVVCLYTPACESCAQIDALLDALPESMEITRGAATFTSAVRIVRIDVTQQPDAARALFDARGIADDRRITPAVFLPDRQLIGSEEILNNLERYVRLGWAVGEVAVSEAAPRASSVGLLSALTSGLIAGLNGCALSMLLMFVSILLETRRRALPFAVAFLASKLAVYLLIGFVLLETLQRFNPVWLLPAARILLTVVGAALIVLNLHDALRARRGHLGDMRNQLPARMRRRLHALIRTLTGERTLWIACIALGAIVAAGEFLCAGQLYLAYLLQSMQTGAGASVPALVVYCLAFLTPAVVITAVVLGCRSTSAVSALYARHIAPVKLLTAAAMLALIVLAWIL